MKASYYRYWGKARKDGVGYHLLVYHCLDVAAVGEVLLKYRHDWRERLSSASGLSCDILGSLVNFFLSLHDIGKFSETFQGLRPDLYLTLSGQKAEKAYLKRHDTLGYVAWKTLWKKWKKKGFLGQAPGSDIFRSGAFE